MGKQSTNEPNVGTGDRAERTRQRRARDDQWVSAAAKGDADAYRHLVEAWTAGAFDRALHRGADERTAAEVVVRTFATLQNELANLEASFGAQVMGAIERDVPARSRALGKAARGAKRAAERLTRGTDPTALGTDPSISSMCWDALDVLGDRARDVTDLHWRHHLASDEIAAATGESIFRVDDIIRKAPQGLGAALRTRLLWAGGKPDHDELGQDLKANNVRQFDSAAVRVIHGHLRACPVCRSRSLIALPAVEVFAAIPLVAVPAELARRLAATTWTPMSGGSPVTAPLPDDTPSARPATSATPEPRTEPPAAEAARPEARDARTVAAGSPTAAVLGAGAASASMVDAPPAPSPTPTSGHITKARPENAPASPVAPAPAPLRTSPLPLQNRSNPAPATPAATPATPVEPPSGGGPAHAPVASRAADRDRGRPRWLVPAGIGVAALIVLGLVVVFTRGDGGETAIDAGPSVESTTTSRPAPTSTTTTTRPPTTTTDSTIAPTTEAPLPTPAPGGGGGGGGGAGGFPVPPPTTKPQSVVASVQYDIAPGTIRLDSTGGSSFSWSVTANGPVTVEVTGPGVSSGAQAGQQTVCAPASSCGEGTHYFSIVVKDGNGRQVGAGTAKLIVRK